MSVESLKVTRKLIAEWCRNATPAVVMLPDSREMHGVTFKEQKDSRVVLEFFEEQAAPIAPRHIVCIHLRFDNANRVLMCKHTSSPSTSANELEVEILSDCMDREPDTEFQIPIRDRRGLHVEVRHNQCNPIRGKLEHITRRGCHIEAPRSSTSKWNLWDTVEVQIGLGLESCRVDAQVTKLGPSIGLEFLDPHTHTLSRSSTLRKIVAELHRRYLRTRIRI